MTDGYAPEGFSLPWAHLWNAEHGLLLAWIAAALFVVARAALNGMRGGGRQR